MGSGKRSTGSHADAVEREHGLRNWVIFIIGNLVSVVGIVTEIMELDVCFDENLADDDDTPQQKANETYHSLLVSLVFGLLVDVFSAVSLSVIYRSPLDIKSVHKIPREATWTTKTAICIVTFLAPLFWCVVYFAGGVVSMNYGSSSLCGGGAGGLALDWYLQFSGWVMLSFGLFMIGLSFQMCIVATNGGGNVNRRYCGCCCWDRDGVHQKVLSLGPLLDFGWQVQGVLLSYRTGALSPIMAFAIGLVAAVGEGLAAFGSFAPEAVQEFAGPV